MKNKPKISIITSLFKTEKYLNKYFENYSCISNINETELILIHNSPNDVENEIIESWKVKFKHFKHIIVKRESIYKSWNRGIAAASGEYIAMWNVDDRRVPDSLEKQAKLLDDNSDCMIVSGHYYKVFNYGDVNGFLKKDIVKKSFFNNFPKFNNGCFLMWRKRVHNEIDYFDEQFKIAGDWEFWCRVTSKYHVMTCNEILGYYLRDSSEGISKGLRDKRNIENHIIKFRYYNLIIVNIYKFLIRKNMHYKSIINYDRKIEKFNVSIFLLVKIIPSFLLFWIPSSRRLLIKYRYKIAQKLVK